MAKKFSNRYIFIFTAIMVGAVALVLSLLATILQPIQERNIRLEKMQSILSSINIEVEREVAEDVFWEYIVQTKVIDYKGKEIKGEAFEIDLQDELRKDSLQRNLPLYIAGVEDDTLYIMPVRGSGLWGPIWGFISVRSDFNTIVGAHFDHESETPGLGAQISEKEFENKFIGKKLYDEDNNFRSVSVVKSGTQPDDPHNVDAITGGTITSYGVSDMLYEGISIYEPYFNK